MKQLRSVLCNHASFGIPTSTKKQKYPQPIGTRSWAETMNSKHFLKTTFTMELPLWTVFLPQLRPPRSLSKESVLSGNIFVLWLTLCPNITDWKPLGFSSWHIVCLVFWQGRLLMGRCGVSHRTSREETLPTHRSAWIATRTHPTFMNHAGKCKQECEKCVFNIRNNLPQSKSPWCSRIQVFHCLKHDGTGGRTLLVDGFYAAEIIREQSPENFELLSRVPIRQEYLEKTGSHHNHMVAISPVFSVYPWNHELYQLRYVAPEHPKKQKLGSHNWQGWLWQNELLTTMSLRNYCHVSCWIQRVFFCC